jgi:CO/xanthine dehydrogenase FAD-binding subunit
MEQKVCNAIVPGDVSVALAALNASIKIEGSEGSKTVPIKDFFIVLGTVLKPDEIVTDIVVPEVPSKGVFLKSRTRSAIDFATASVALATTSKGTTVALGGVAPIIPTGTPDEMKELERLPLSFFLFCRFDFSSESTSVRFFTSYSRICRRRIG